MTYEHIDSSALTINGHSSQLAITPTQLNDLQTFGAINDAFAVNYNNVLEYLELKTIDKLYLLGINFGGVVKSATDITEAQSEVWLSDDLQVKIYPNPSNGLISIQYNLGQESESGQLAIFNISGQKILTDFELAQIGTLNLDMSNYEPGIYIVRITSDSGLVSTTKLIIQ